MQKERGVGEADLIKGELIEREDRDDHQVSRGFWKAAGAFLPIRGNAIFTFIFFNGNSSNYTYLRR